MNNPIILDCTLRDGGYYNSWDFPVDLINDYLEAMAALPVGYVELGLRSLKNDGFKGGCAYSTDQYIRSLQVPEDLKVGVMVNASELVGGEGALAERLSKLFVSAADSPVTLVRVACHVHEFEAALEASRWLKAQGYCVGFNLMQVADRSDEDIRRLSRLAAEYPLDVLYFADSMGSMTPEDTRRLVKLFRENWRGAMGIHTHDNMGNALANTMAALDEGVAWLDATVTGMGRGPGNTKTEYLALTLSGEGGRDFNITPLLSVIRTYFEPLKNTYQWGSNPYYFLAGQHGIHPTYIQEMLGDQRYSEEDILAAIDHLKLEGGKRFSLTNLEAARHFFRGELAGTWSPSKVIKGREVLVLGSGPGVGLHREILELYINTFKPFVIALNAQEGVDESLVDVRAACHPVRLLADCSAHRVLPQPLITPYSMLPDDVRQSLQGKEILDYGLKVSSEAFDFYPTSAQLPNSLVVAYVLAIATSGGATRISLAGFDGFSADDPRNSEMERLLNAYFQHSDHRPLRSITPTRYRVPTISVYGLVS
ncbi:aldolase catalytic domain-containing protein [Marinobacter sp.]|uniref:aldolase catalytic domain-containing protein n=1 Tax=Marinobacter sp. TaxID=50741 RepID=UPI002B265D83|nr:aldolase catalytic domain-containing protein [Marinobacter sp.]